MLLTKTCSCLQFNDCNLFLQTLVNGDRWASAVEQALGNLLNAFIVTDHKDCLLLRACAKEANYSYLQIIVYDFSRPRYLDNLLFTNFPYFGLVCLRLSDK